MKDLFTPAKIVGYGVVALICGLLAVQYVRALGPSALDDRMSPCRSLEPGASNPRIPSFPVQSIEFQAANEKGDMVSLSQYRGRVVFLNFWQTTCPPCVAEMPSMERLASELGTREFAMLALASEKTWDPIKKFFRGRATGMTVLLDPPDGDEAIGNISLSYGTSKWPETYLIDKRGVVRYYFINKRDWTSPRARQCIKALMEE